MRKRCPKVVVGTAAAIALTAAGARPIWAAELPGNWRRLNERFEAFLISKHNVWPRSGIQISPDGRFSHTLAFRETDRQHLSLEFFRRGRRCLGVSLQTDLDVMGEGRARIFTPGDYAASVLSNGAAGYQHHAPIAWFTVTDPVPRSPGLAGGAADRRIFARTADVTDSAEIWPNERMLAFLDLHVLSGLRNPNRIRKRNELCEPSVVLEEDDRGIVRRALLNDKTAEQALRWQVYFDGKLVDKGSANGVTELRCNRGAGTYIVFMGFDGANGFIPVSNMREFPLFPDGAGGFVIRPPDTDRDDLPDFVEAIIAAEPSIQTVPRSSFNDTDGDGAPDLDEDSSLQVEGGSTANNSHLLELWGDWRYLLRLYSRSGGDGRATLP